MDRRGRPLGYAGLRNTASGVVAGKKQSTSRAERAARRAEQAALDEIRKEKAKRLGALFAAVKRGDLEAIREMELNENDFGSRDEKELTVLMHAVLKENPAVVKYLLAKGASKEVHLGDVEDDPKSSTALMMAAFGGNLEIVKALVEAGADVSEKDHDNMTARDLAIQKDKPKVAAYLGGIEGDLEEQERYERRMDRWRQEDYDGWLKWFRQENERFRRAKEQGAEK
tara:strand:+ start:1716 stop:2396 length:681 start_codon:yes stop_codon:yes gene_type:complete